MYLGRDFTHIASMNSPFLLPRASGAGCPRRAAEPVARHAVRFCAWHRGRKSCLFDGRGGEYQARIERIEKER